MTNVALQIASFINQLKILSESQRQGIANMSEVIVAESEKEGAGFSDGVAFGSFLAWGIVHVEKDILHSINKISEALAPLGLNHEMEMLAREELFHPHAEATDILPDLKRAEKIISRRLQVFSRIEKSLLTIPEEEIFSAYSPETLANFQDYWDGELESLMDNV